MAKNTTKTAAKGRSVFQTMSSEAMEAGTGKDLKTWLAILEAWEMEKKGHTLTAKHLRDKYKLSNWWSQAVTIRYEWEKGLRK